MTDEDLPRHWTQDMTDLNDHDLREAIDMGQMVAICDEEAGGIIAYAIGYDHADRIVEALNAHRA